ncbi:MAG: Arm DNA-binding domain-containing protein, partial [Roseovarius sp.]
MPMVSCKIDRAQIEKYTREQRASGQRVTLADQVCSGLKLVINSQSASWTYAYRKRGYLDGGKRHPQRTMKLGDPVNMTPAEARLAAEQIKALVRAGGDPAMAQRQERAAQQAEEARRKTCSDWLDNYALNQMDGGRTKYQREEVRNAQLALEEMGLLELFPDAVAPKHIRSLIDLHST